VGGPNDGYAGWRGEASAELNAGGPRRPPRRGARRLVPGGERGAEGQGRGTRRCHAGRPEPRARAGPRGRSRCSIAPSEGSRPSCAHPRSPRSRPHAVVRDLHFAGELQRRGLWGRRHLHRPEQPLRRGSTPQIAATRASVVWEAPERWPTPGARTSRPPGTFPDVSEPRRDKSASAAHHAVTSGRTSRRGSTRLQ
jgi:hypothetical protein